MDPVSGRDGGRASEIFRRATARLPDAKESTALAGLFVRQRARFAADPAAARKLVNVGASSRGHELAAVELAAWTVVAQTVLNLDEVVTRR